MARFDVEGIAGPHLGHRIPLLLHYFPGDGEAIVRAELTFDTAVLSVQKAEAVIGQLKRQGSILVVDYTQQPLAQGSTDTLYVDLSGNAADVEALWQGRLFSSADAAVAHQVEFALGIRQPVALEAVLEPAQVFPGEELGLRLKLDNSDLAGRAVESLALEWPEGIVPVDGSKGTLDQPLAAGASATLEWKVRIDRQQAGVLPLLGRVEAAQVVGSPLPALELRIAAAPQVEIRAPEGLLLAGKKGLVVCTWRNPAAVAVELAALRVELPVDFADIEVKGQGLQPVVEAPTADRGGSFLLEGPIQLAPGEAFSAEVEVFARRPGPFTWTGHYQPVGGEGFLPLGKGPPLRVVRQAADQKPGISKYPSDLQVVTRAFGAQLDLAFNALSLPVGSAVYLEADDKSDRNWLVDEILAAKLRQRGYRVVLEAPAAGSAQVARLHYRLADARVLYTPLKPWWKPFGGKRRREVYGDLFLRLARSEGSLAWTRRIQTYAADVVPSHMVEVLGGADIVDRTVVKAENKVIERGLSASIIGGLAFIFFAP